MVSARRTDAPWARGFRAYVYLGLLVIAIRVVFRMLLDAQYGAHILFTLPEVPLPDAVAGIRLGGAVSAEGVLAAVYDGLRLATLLLCVGAANTLANPKRLLQSMPAALHEIGVAVTVALSVAPQLIESGQRVHARPAAARRAGSPLPHRPRGRPAGDDRCARSVAAPRRRHGLARATAAPRPCRVDPARARAALLLGGLVGDRDRLLRAARQHRAALPRAARCCSAGVAIGWAGWCSAAGGSSGAATGPTRGGSRSGACRSSASSWRR